jgi:pimeloyl-ACP methyl ester carboxylesterase
MPIANVRGVSLNYEVLGDRGPAMALTPGGRNPIANIRPYAEKVAAKGYRVLIHDRRNCGASDVSFDGSKSEYEVWADDLHTLLKQLGMLPAIVGGTSSGARLSLLLAMRYPQDVRALILWRITGGEFAIKRLTEKYYDQYIRLAQQGGMAAVCQEEHFAERIRDRAGNRERLMALDPNEFIATLRKWREPFVASDDLPLIGTTEADLRSIPIPTCIIPGDDLTHGSKHGENASRLLPNSELHWLTTGDREVDITPPEEWIARAGAIADIFADFLDRKLPKQAQSQQRAMA